MSREPSSPSRGGSHSGQLSPAPEVYLQLHDKVVGVHDPSRGTAFPAQHRAHSTEEQGRGKDGGHEHLGRSLELNLLAPSRLAVFKALQTGKNPDIKLIPSAHFFSVS